MKLLGHADNINRGEFCLVPTEVTFSRHEDVPAELRAAGVCRRHHQRGHSLFFPLECHVVAYCPWTLRRLEWRGTRRAFDQANLTVSPDQEVLLGQAVITVGVKRKLWGHSFVAGSARFGPDGAC